MKDEEKSAKGTITNNFYGPVGQFINHVETNHIHTANDCVSDKEADSDCCPHVQPVPLMATSEMMQRAVVESVKMGLWWSNRSWAVVYRVWQMKGYMHG
nr:hypothetical protein [Bacteroidaceae bacterium]